MEWKADWSAILNCQPLFLPLPFSPQTISQENKEILPLDIQPHTVPKDKVLKSVQVHLDFITEMWHNHAHTPLCVHALQGVHRDGTSSKQSPSPPVHLHRDWRGGGYSLDLLPHQRLQVNTHTLFRHVPKNTVPSCSHTDARWESTRRIKRLHYFRNDTVHFYN